MRPHSKLLLALAMSILALGPMACTSSSWCADCEQATAILGLNYQPVNTYTVGTAIPVNPPNPSGGTPRIYTVESGVLPPGLSLDPATGRITGTPTAAGVYTLTIRGANSANSASQTIQITVVPAQPLALSYATPQVFPAASAIAVQNPVLAQATPGLPTTYAITAGSLPAGLTLNADGTISGTPATPGVFPFTATATNGARTATASATYTVTPAGSLGLTYATPKVFGAGLAITAQPAALLNPTPGVPTSYAVTTGTLPAGLSLHATTGDITGTPTAPGVFPFTVTATNGTRAATSSPAYTVTPSAALTLAYVTPQTFTSGTAIGTQVATLSNPTPGVATTYALTGGTFPPGLSLDPATGSIAGTPTAPGVYTFTATATNGTRNADATATYTVVPVGALGLDYTSPQTFTAGSAIATQVPSITNPTPGLTTTFAVTGDALPAGLTLNPDGTITGTPTTPGVYTFTITATNGARTAASSPTYTVTPAAALTVDYTTPQIFIAGTAIATQTPVLANPTPGVATSYAVTAGTLPDGLTLNADGTITGSPTTPGIHVFTITATNGTRTATSSPSYTVVPAAALTVDYATPQTFTAGTAITTQAPVLANLTPGVATTYAVTSGALPDGLALNADGSIIGTPTTPGVYAFTITATNGTRVALSSPTYTVPPAAALSLAYTTPQTYPVGTAITTQAAGLGNATPGLNTTYALTGGSLPAGLTLDAGTGSISGTPAVPGLYTFTITATNGGRSALSNTTTYTVNPAANLAVSYASPQTFPVGSAISTQSPVLANANPGLTTTYAISSGSLPAGLTLSSDGTITGTPTSAGVYTFAITATNGTRTPAMSNLVAYTVSALAPTALNYTSPITYTASLTIANNDPNPTGGAPTAYSIAGGSLPAGLSLDPATGVISGTPTAGGTFSVTISGSNSAGGTSQILNITVLAYPTANLSSNPSTVPIGQSSSLTVLFTGSASGTAVLTGDGIATPLAVTSGTSVPTGVVNVPGTLRSYSLTVTNAQGYTATSQTTVQWIPVPLDTWTVTLPTTGGGPLTPGSGNLLQGQIAITVPNQGQSLCGDVTLTVNKEDALPGAIVAAARDYSHTFNIASNLGYPFRVPITITLAYDPTLASPSLTGTELPLAFYWDPSYSKWVATGLKAVDTTAHTVTFTTLLPGRYAVLGVPSLTVATQNLGFASSTDDWRQNNPSVYDLPGGASLGMSSFASWFFPFGKPANGGTGLFNQFPTVSDANAAALISRLANGTMDSWEALWNQGTYTLTDRQTGLALLTGLLVTGQPQVFLMSDARPAVNNGLATAICGYDNATGRFKVMDPNYPGNALTIAWSAGSGFSSYDRDAGYSPALAKFAFEGQTSIHRLADYDRILSGAATGFPAATFATINVTSVAEVTSPNPAQDVVVADANNITVSGTVVNGDETASHIYWSQNGSAPRTAVPLVGNAFTFTIPALADPYATTVALETTSTPCDPSFAHSGFTKFVVKQSSLTPWFTNSCFENGQANPSPWVLQQGSNTGVGYPASPTFSSTTGQMNAYSIAWSNGSADSALVHSAAHAADPNVPAIAMVLDGDYSFQVNNPANGAHISRMYETITVPATVANPKLTFYWAAAMQSAGHVPAQLPYVDILVQDVTNNHEVLYFVHHYPPSTVGATTYTDGYPGWVAGNGTGANKWFGINWQKVGLNLGAGRQGHQLKITVMAADCTQGGHGGYAYIDNIGCN